MEAPATASDRISWFPVPDESELPADLQGLFRTARERIGFVPNVFRTYAYRPERLSAWVTRSRLLHEETPRPDRRGARDDRGRRVDGQRLPVLPRRAWCGVAGGV